MMEAPHPVNSDAQRLLARLSGKIFIRLIHAGYDPKTEEPARLKPRHFYGELPDVLNWLNTVAKRLNDGSNDDLKFDVYYCANDPQNPHSLAKGSVSTLRAIYQDCDDFELALIEPELDGEPAHAVIESSPGKRQRLWVVGGTGIPAHRARAIHDHMCTRHHHDTSTHGAERLLRLPGFRNWKYPDGPLSRLVSERPGELTPEHVNKAFGFHIHDDYANNMNAVMQNAQRSGQLPNHNVIQLEKEKAKRSGIQNNEADADRRNREAKDLGANLDTSELLNALSLIDPDGSREEWRRVIGALDYMAGDDPWGRQIAELWSMQGVNKYDPKSFALHWNGLDRTIEHPFHWLSIKRITAGRKHTKETRALRQCAAFKRFEEEHPGGLVYQQLWIQYPHHIKIAINEETSAWRPDPKSRQNVAYLLKIENIEIWFDTFAGVAMYSKDGIVAEIDQQLIMELYSTAHATDFRIDDSFLAKQIDGLALDQKRDPVRTYFENLPLWDMKPRIETVFQRLMGAPDCLSVREILMIFMVAIVRRTFKPGTKFDMMPILEGKQGLGKSSFFRILMPNPDFFGEGPKMDEEAKRLLSMLGGKLVIEFAELAGMSARNTDAIKKLITQQVDEYIANHARKKTRVPRRCVFVGSVNKTQYLRDLTDNRRFPVVPVTTELDYAALQAERDQLWAEALAMENVFGDLRLSPEAEADMKVMQEDRLDVNTETTAVIRELSTFKEGCLDVETIWNRLVIPYEDRAKRTGHAQYLFKEIKDLMERDGWSWNKPIRIGDTVVRGIWKRRKRGPVPLIVLNGNAFEYASTKLDAEIDISDLI